MRALGLLGDVLLARYVRWLSPYQVHLALRSGATATLINGRVSSSYEHRLGAWLGSPR